MPFNIGRKRLRLKIGEKITTSPCGNSSATEAEISASVTKLPCPRATSDSVTPTTACSLKENGSACAAAASVSAMTGTMSVPSLIKGIRMPREMTPLYLFINISGLQKVNCRLKV